MNCKDFEGAKKDYIAFIGGCKGNERKLCQAYYHLGYISLVSCQQNKTSDNASFWTAKEYHKRGLEAEKNMCPIFHEPKSTYREILEQTLSFLDSKFRKCGGSMCDQRGTKTCARCKAVHYCSKVCQENDWAGHKTVCRSKKNLS